MKIRNLDGSRDWSFGGGLASYATDNAAIAVNIETRLKSWVGNCFFDTAMGIDWSNLMGKGKQQDLLAALRALILQSYGVVQLSTLAANFNPATRNLTVTYTIDTIFSSGFQQQVAAAAGTMVS